MAYRTVESIIKAAIREGMKIYTDAAITSTMIQTSVDAYNASEPFIWRKWPWTNRKIDEIEVSPDEDGVIVFDGTNSDVDLVQAVRSVSTNGGTSPMVWNQDDVRAAINGESICSGTFQKLVDDDDGYRRIKVDVEDGVSTYKVLAFRRFVQAEVNENYSSGDPSATPYDYRVLTWKIDRAEAPLVAYIADELRAYMSKEKDGTWTHGLNGTIKDIRDQEATEKLMTPAEGKFGGMGDWY